MSISAYSPPEQVRAEVCAQLAAIDTAQARLRELSTFGVGNGFRVEVIETLETQVRRGQGLSYRMLGEALDPPEGDDAQFRCAT